MPVVYKMTASWEADCHGERLFLCPELPSPVIELHLGATTSQRLKALQP